MYNTFVYCEQLCRSNIYETEFALFYLNIQDNLSTQKTNINLF